jgi:pre-mRNA-splicing factor 38A
MQTVHGTNPQTLLETITRSRIYETLYWKSDCFGLTAATLVDKAVDLKYIGGLYGNQRPSEFLCLTLKLLQLQPEKEILFEYIQQPHFKYLTAIGSFCLRLIGTPLEIYTHLEPLLSDYRKLKHRGQSK